MKTFKDLSFIANSLEIQAKIHFDNGWGASVVKGHFTYGGNSGKYELAILDDYGNLCYHSGLGDDKKILPDFCIFGYLTEEAVTELMIKIQKLKPTVKVERDNKIKDILDDTSSD